jgi:hypothetical protein
MSAPKRFSPAELDRLKRLDIAKVADRLGVGPLRRSGGKLIGACPICGVGSGHPKTATCFELKVKDSAWMCAACSEGGDTIALVQRKLGLSFVDAAEWLGGSASVAPGPAAPAAAPRDDNKFREWERRRLWQAYQGALPGTGSPIEGYCEIRHIDPEFVRHARLRFAPAFSYFHGEEDDPDAAKPGKKRPRVIHVGPAMLAPILRPDHHFGGLHITYLDLTKPKGKAEIFDPDTGELLPAKKVRGSKKGGRIELIRVPRPRLLYAGEGIETVGFVWTCLKAAGRLRDGAAWWSGVDMGNLAGPADTSDRIRHPTLKGALGRARSVPGPTPDLDEPAMPVPDSVIDMTWLADGDSDPFTTRIVMDRAVARNARHGRTQRVAWPPEGWDFNDLGLRGYRPASAERKGDDA